MTVTLDVAQAYHTIKIADESKHVTAFTSPLGLFHFKAMAFGLLNAGARYSCFSEGLERKVNSKNLVNYVDDTLIFLKLKAKKCHFLKDHVTFLGHKISAFSQ